MSEPVSNSTSGNGLMSLSTPTTTPTAADGFAASMRKYLDGNNVHKILEDFVRDVGEHRPQDVLLFMEEWARARRCNVLVPWAPGGLGAVPRSRQSSGAGTPNSRSGSFLNPRTDAPRVNSPEAARLAWSQIPDKAAVGRRFFDILFTQHASLKRRVFNGVDIAAITTPFVELLDRVIQRSISVVELHQLTQQFSEKRQLEVRVYHYFLTAMLSALSITLGDQFEGLAEPFRVLLTSIIDEVMTANGHKPRKTSMSRSVINNDRLDVPGIKQDAHERILKSWAALDDKGKVAGRFFDVLFTQHKTVKRRLFNDIDVTALQEPMLQYIEEAVLGKLSASDLAKMGREHAAGRQVGRRHFDYFLSAFLTALKAEMGAELFDECGRDWQQLTRFVTEHLFAGIEQTETPAERFDASQSSAPGGRRSGPYLIVVPQWNAIADKALFAHRFFTSLFTQHPLMRKRLFEGVDIDAVTGDFVNALDGAINGTLAAPVLRALAAEAGAGRKVEGKHYDYFLTAVLSAVSASVGEKEYTEEANKAWQEVLTELVGLCMAGRPPVDAGGPHMANPVTHRPADISIAVTSGSAALTGAAAKLGSSGLMPPPAPGTATASPSPMKGDAQDPAELSLAAAVATVRTSWEGLGDAQQRDVTTKFFTTLFTQHATLKRRVFAAVDPAQVAPALQKVMTEALAGKLCHDDLAALAKQYGEGRRLQERHYQYFLTAMLTSVGDVVGKAQFRGDLATAWSDVLTSWSGAAQEGAPALADSQSMSSITL